MNIVIIITKSLQSCPTVNVIKAKLLNKMIRTNTHYVIGIDCLQFTNEEIEALTFTDPSSLGAFGSCNSL